MAFGPRFPLNSTSWGGMTSGSKCNSHTSRNRVRKPYNHARYPTRRRARRGSFEPRARPRVEAGLELMTASARRRHRPYDNSCWIKKSRTGKKLRPASRKRHALSVKLRHMETVRLRAIQEQPSRVERLLVAFALRSGIVSPDAHMVRDQRLMPAVLQGIIFRAMRNDRAWCACKDNSRIRLLTCEMLLDPSRERRSPVLNVHLYGEGGDLKDCASWAVNDEGRWRRRSGTTAQGLPPNE